MIIELHAIQTFGPTNLNRDDTGNPKEALFGGVRRARVSSQSAKRAMRISDVFGNAIDVPTGTRTKKLVQRVIDTLVPEGVPEEWVTEYATAIATDVYAKLDSKSDHDTSVLLYISDDEINWITRTLYDAHQQGTPPDVKAFTKEFVKALSNRTSAPDIALFGRMLAGKPELNIDAACQVAHMLSTHEVNSAEFDYFTAVDDFQSEDTSGAGMLGLVAFNSATYYRCMRVDWEQLVLNLGGDSVLASKTVAALMQAFALVVPSGMKNSFVNQHAPDFLMAVVRRNNDGQSLMNAFEKPIKTKHASGYAEPSIHELATYWEQVEGAFRLSDPVVAVMNPRGYAIPSEELNNSTVSNLRDWVSAIVHELNGA